MVSGLCWMVLGLRAGASCSFCGCRMYNRNSYGGQGWLMGVKDVKDI